MSEAILSRAKYLNGSSIGCPVYRALKPGGVLNSILCLELMNFEA